MIAGREYRMMELKVPSTLPLRRAARGALRGRPQRLLAERYGALRDRVGKMIDLYTDTTFRSGSVATLVREHARRVEAIDRQDVDAAPRIISEMMERLRVVAATVMHVVQSTPRQRARRRKGERP